MKISEKAVLANLKVSRWGTSKHDKNADRVISERYQLADSVGRYTKTLMKEEALKDIGTIANQARNYHNEVTLAWSDSYGRILPTKMIAEWRAQMEKYEVMFQKAVEYAEKHYPSYVENAETTLGKLFKREEYPKSITDYYSFAFEITNVPDQRDFRIDLEQGELDRIKKDMEKNMGNSLNTAMGDLYNKVQKTVDALVVKLDDETGVFRDSLIGNIQDIVELLPKLNIMEDKKIDDIGKEIKEKLLKHNPEEIRGDRKTRKEVADEAKKIVSAMAGFGGKV